MQLVGFGRPRQLGGEFGRGALEQAIQVQAVAFFRAQLQGCVFDQWAGGWRQLELLVELTQQFQYFPVLGGQFQCFTLSQRGGDLAGPVTQFQQVAIFIQRNVAGADSQGTHNQLLTLSYCRDRATKAG